MLSELLNRPLVVDANKTAIIFMGSRITYGQLDQQVQLTANALDQTSEPGSHIAIIARNSLNYFILYLAIRRSGRVAVLINWRLPPQTQAAMTESALCTQVFRDQDLVQLPQSDRDIGLKCLEDSPGLFLYTSGSTGEPKAAVVLNKHRQNLINRLYTLDPGVELGYRIAVSPFYHMNGLSTIENIIAGLGTAIIMTEFNSTDYLRLVNDYRTVRMTIVPSMLAMCLEDPTINNYDWSFVKAIVLATSPVSRGLYNRARQVFTAANIRVRYGLTEIGPVFGPAPRGMEEPELSCGYPQKGVECRIINGVLHLRANSMSSGYHNSSSSRVTNGWLNTGDLFRMDNNGFYFFMGRADDMYKVGGEQVYPQEIESAMENVQGVQQACVVMLEDEVKGFKPYAFVSGLANIDIIKAALLNTLPRFKIPREIWRIDSMPLHGVGKIDKKLLTARAKELIK